MNFSWISNYKVWHGIKTDLLNITFTFEHTEYKFDMRKISSRFNNSF